MFEEKPIGNVLNKDDYWQIEIALTAIAYIPMKGKYWHKKNRIYYRNGLYTMKRIILAERNTYSDILLCTKKGKILAQSHDLII